MNEELKATEALLDIGVSVPLRPLRFRKWKLPIRVTIKRPPLGGLLRLLRVWLSLGVTVSGLDKMSRDEELEFMAKHGKTVSRFVALAICNGHISGKLFARPLSWLLRWRCHPDTLLHTMNVFMNLLDTKSFMTITKLGSAINLLAPRMGLKKKRS